MSKFNDPTAIATPAQYRAALLAVRQRMTPAQLAMLQAHCRSAGHTASLDALAAAVGSPATAYSNYARMIAEELKVVPEATGKKQNWLYVLAYGQPDAGETLNGQYQWIMRPELVETLQAMKWA